MIYFELLIILWMLDGVREWLRKERIYKRKLKELGR